MLLGRLIRLELTILGMRLYVEDMIMIPSLGLPQSGTLVWDYGLILYYQIFGSRLNLINSNVQQSTVQSLHLTIEIGKCYVCLNLHHSWNFTDNVELSELSLQ